MSYFKHHVFFCCNQRAEGEGCCNDLGATAAQTYAKDRIAQLGLKGKGKIRINKAGCLDRCDDGPVLVNLTPYNPYSVAALAVWRQGHFLNFNGLTRLTATLWPFLALPALVLLARRT